MTQGKKVEGTINFNSRKRFAASHYNLSCPKIWKSKQKNDYICVTYEATQEHSALAVTEELQEALRTK